MRDIESTPTNISTNAVNDSPAVASKNPAVAMIDEGNALEEQGRIREAMARYNAAVRADPKCARAHLNRGNILLAGDRFDEARAAYQLAIACDPHYAAGHFNLGNLNYGAGEFEPALRNYQAAIGIRPDFADALVAMANTLDGLGRTAEAVDCYERALVINPSYAEVHFNLGILAITLGRHDEAAKRLHTAIDIHPDYAAAHYQLGRVLHAVGRIDEALDSIRHAITVDPRMYDAHYSLGIILQHVRPNPSLEEAVASFRRAVEIKPDFAQGHHALGILLSNLAQLDAAEESLRRGFAIKPESPEILHDLAMNLLSSGKSPEAVQLIVRTLDRTPTWTTKLAFSSCVARTRFTINDSETRAALTTAITEPWGAPYELCRPALSMIMLNPRIASCVRLANGSWPARLPKAALYGADGLAALAADPLLHALLEASPVTTIEFERFLTCARHALLETVLNKQAPDSSDIAALRFYAALSRQCFVNEYIFDCLDRERLDATASRSNLLALMAANAVVPSILLLAVAAYFPLYALPNADRLLTLSEPGPADEVLRQQIREPLEEQALRAKVKSLTSISGGVSEDVRNQYEQNPYPRWVKLPIHDQALHFNDELRRTLPFAPFMPMLDDSAPEVLIAGCGTGGQPILVAQRFRGIRVLAIDLSLSSISYAKRKTQERGMTNIEYAHADILKLGDVARTFDIIESVGVLHHLADPFAGWRTLLSRLRPGGFMRLGLYSKLARRHVVKAREFIAARAYGSTPDDIRRFRQDFALQDASLEVQLSKTSDFYSTSECRDLLFHVKEHHLTLSQIESFLTEFGLQFIGFELDPRVLSQYRACFADDPAGTKLNNWARFEEDNPDTFAGMYRFWIQQPVDR
jgi:tetratricopeptide (TPR) repeat protein/2-polyprenyl-3-methyl-5-hydroxy-6-metoxy-1,4-benzoquinol methylase